MPYSTLIWVRRQYICRSVLLLWVVVSILILIIVASDESALFYIPLFVGPAVGMYWVFYWSMRLLSTLRDNLGFSVFFAIFLTPIGFMLLSTLFAIGYAAAIKLGDPIVSKEGEPISGFGNLVYFAIVTGSTLGYGDFAPQGRARLLTCIQLMEFWMFLAVGILYLQNAVAFQREATSTDLRNQSYVAPHSRGGQARRKTGNKRIK